MRRCSLEETNHKLHCRKQRYVARNSGSIQLCVPMGGCVLLAEIGACMHHVCALTSCHENEQDTVNCRALKIHETSAHMVQGMCGDTSNVYLFQRIPGIFGSTTEKFRCTACVLEVKSMLAQSGCYGKRSMTNCDSAKTMVPVLQIVHVSASETM